MYNPVKPTKKRVLNLIERTWHSPYLSVTPGTYATFKRLFNYEEVDHTDGIGTKGYYHWKERTFKNAVLDALAMNLNDLAMVGAIPYKLQNHIVLPEDNNPAVIEIVRVLVRECLKRDIVITGGETSIHDTSGGLDLSISVSGFIKQRKINKFQVGDMMIALPSNGLHSNGFTKVRNLFKKELRLEFTQPTTIYSNTVLSLYNNYDLHGLMHITGGAFTKLKDLLNGMDAYITNTHKLKPSAIFYDIYKKGCLDEEMYKTFNCGIGFIFSVNPKDVCNILKEVGSGDVIGEIAPGAGKVKINSMFSDQTIIL